MPQTNTGPHVKLINTPLFASGAKKVGLELTISR